MALAFPISIALLLAVFSLVGYIRDLRRGVLALLGTLAGASLADLWAARWGAALAARFTGSDVPRMTFFVSCALFLWAVLLVGYGGGLLFGRSQARPPLQRRLIGALLGLLNGLLIVAYLLRFAAGQSSLKETIQAAPLLNIFYEGLPLLFLGAAIAMTLAVLVVSLRRLGQRRTAAPLPAADTRQAAAPAASSPAPTPRVNDRDVLNKIKDASGR